MGLPKVQDSRRQPWRVLLFPFSVSATGTYGGVRGRWLTLEPFITPYLYEPYLESETPAIDEWTLSVNLGPKLAQVLENHYATFIVRSVSFSKSEPPDY
jgi:hypothetical protein